MDNLRYPERFSVCESCISNIDGYCTEAKMNIEEFINYRLAWCPRFKW